ncbi:hypothetical protein JD969_13470 [Planctomycetota bacterium]|nr:hypothetical protein JD969_13470 [Planctomycetota bacterium]
MMDSMLLLLAKVESASGGTAGKVAQRVVNGVVDNRAKSSDVGRAFKNKEVGNMIPTEWIMIAGGIVLFAFGMIGFVQWWKGRHERSQPMTVFYRVGKQAGLKKREMWLLRKIAKYTGLPTPLTLMMSSGTLIVHAGVYVEARAIPKPEALMDDVERIAGKLFDGYVKGQHGEGKSEDVKLDDEVVSDEQKALAEALKMVG